MASYLVPCVGRDKTLLWHMDNKHFIILVSMHIAIIARVGVVRIFTSCRRVKMQPTNAITRDIVC